MRETIRYASILAVVALLAPLARAADEVPLPNINKRGDDEKAFVKKLANAIVPAARSSIKSATVEKYEKKEPKAGRTEYHITAGFKGVASKKDYTATIVVYIDSSDAKKWEVTRIKYSDDSKNVIGPSTKKVNALVDKINAASK